MRARSGQIRWVGGALWALASCDDPAPEAVDSARFDVRDSVVEPRPDVPVTDASIDADVRADDAQPFDATADRAASDAPGSDATAMCAQIADEYAAAVVAAQTCLVGSACREQVCESLCCACRVYVNPMSDAYGHIAALAAQWQAARCTGTLECPRIPCGAATGAVCSGEGRCVTLRGITSDGGAFDTGADDAR